MKKSEAEEIMKNYKEVDDDTDEEYGFQIVSYEGVDSGGNHLFRCIADGTEDEQGEPPVYAVVNKAMVVVIPT